MVPGIQVGAGTAGSSSSIGSNDWAGPAVVMPKFVLSVKKDDGNQAEPQGGSGNSGSGTGNSGNSPSGSGGGSSSSSGSSTADSGIGSNNASITDPAAISALLGSLPQPTPLIPHATEDL